MPDIFLLLKAVKAGLLSLYRTKVTPHYLRNWADIHSYKLTDLTTIEFGNQQEAFGLQILNKCVSIILESGKANDSDKMYSTSHLHPLNQDNQLKNNTKILTALLIAIFASACTTASKLDRTLVHKEKIRTVNLQKLDQNINIQVSDNTTTSAVAGGLVGILVGGAIDANINSKREKAIEPLREKITDIDVNKVLVNALTHYLSEGKAFSNDVVINTEYDENTKKSFLVPILTPNVVVLANYSGVRVSLAVSTAQTQNSTKKKQKRYTSVYISQQDLDAELASDKETSKKFWAENPVLLKEKIVDGLYDVSKQFADDYNAEQESE